MREDWGRVLYVVALLCLAGLIVTAAVRGW